MEEGIRVLIVDDIPQVRQGLASLLGLATKTMKTKIKVVGEAQDGCKAIELARALHPDVVLMDLEMPVMDGYIATQRIKSNNPSIFIIILTIHDDPASRQKAAQVGADMFIEKSAPPEKLVQVIQGFMGANLSQELI